jgi:DTW domain-containing protein
LIDGTFLGYSHDRRFHSVDALIDHIKSGISLFGKNASFAHHAKAKIGKRTVCDPAQFEAAQNQPVFRKICGHCRQPDFSCYCATLKPFNPGIKFLILSHPLEYHKRIATGRMAHLNLTGSNLFEGEDYSLHSELNVILHDPEYFPVVLYPGRNSVNLTNMSPEARFDLVPQNRTLAVIVIDGTWATARKMMRLSSNINRLPRICFTPPSPSNFRIRKQPKADCYSTIEAIHHTVELMGPGSRAHDVLLDVFDQMINRQIELAHSGKPDRRTLSGRR